MKELVNLTIDRVIIPTDREKPVQITIKIPVPFYTEMKYIDEGYDVSWKGRPIGN